MDMAVTMYTHDRAHGLSRRSHAYVRKQLKTGAVRVQPPGHTAGERLGTEGLSLGEEDEATEA